MAGHLKMNAAVLILYDYVTALRIPVPVSVHAKAVFIGNPVGGFQGLQAVGQDR